MSIQEEEPQWTFYNDEQSTRRKQQQHNFIRGVAHWYKTQTFEKN